MLGDGRVIPAIPVVDLDRSKEFYGEKLGLQPVAVDMPDSQLYKCGLGTYLVIYQQSEQRLDQHVATFLVDEIESEVARLRARGVAFEEYDLPGLKTLDGIASVGPIKGA